MTSEHHIIFWFFKRHSGPLDKFIVMSNWILCAETGCTTEFRWIEEEERGGGGEKEEWTQRVAWKMIGLYEHSATLSMCHHTHTHKRNGFSSSCQKYIFCSRQMLLPPSSMKLNKPYIWFYGTLDIGMWLDCEMNTIFLLDCCGRSLSLPLW